MLFIAALAIYTLTSPGPTAYDQYGLFADRLLHGSLSLPQRPPHLEMAEYEGRAYFTNPPTPSLIMLPFLAIAEREPFRTFFVKRNGGWNFPFGGFQTGLSLIMGALAVALARIGLGRVPQPFSRRERAERDRIAAAGPAWAEPGGSFGLAQPFGAAAPAGGEPSFASSATLEPTLGADAPPARRRLSHRAANWGAILFGFGSIYWYHATIGSVWYVAQIVQVAMMWLLVIEWLGKARPALLGLWIAAAFWCRMETMLASPFVLVTLTDRWLAPRVDQVLPRIRWRWLFAFAAPIVTVIALEFLYNYVRYGTIENYGYRMLIEKPEVAPMYPYGLLSWRYWPGHYHVLFKAKPIFMSTFPYVAPSVGGGAIWSTTPAFIYAFRAPLDRLTAACWLGIVLFLAILFQHCGTGMTQLGYRFAMDFYPLLVVLTMRGMDRPLRRWHVAFVVACVVINAWYVYVLNILVVQRLW